MEAGRNPGPNPACAKAIGRHGLHSLQRGQPDAQRRADTGVGAGNQLAARAHSGFAVARQRAASQANGFHERRDKRIEAELGRDRNEFGSLVDSPDKKFQRLENGNSARVRFFNNSEQRAGNPGSHGC